MSVEDFRKGAEFLQSGLKKKLTPQARRLLEELVVIDRHSLLTWQFVDAVNRKKAGEPNRLEEVSRELVDYRTENKDLIGWNWPALWGHPRGEQHLWPIVEWYRNDVLKQHEKKQSKAEPGTVFNNDFENGTPGDWKERTAFKKVIQRPEGKGYCLELAAGPVNEVGVSRHNVKVSPGHYRLHAEYCMSEKTSSICFTAVSFQAGAKQSVLNLVEKRKDDKWQQTNYDFEVPPGIGSLTFYVTVGKGDGSVFLDNIKLEKIDTAAEDAI